MASEIISAIVSCFQGARRRVSWFRGGGSRTGRFSGARYEALW